LNYVSAGPGRLQTRWDHWCALSGNEVPRLWVVNLKASGNKRNHKYVGGKADIWIP
jgi:hypothetical protein